MAKWDAVDHYYSGQGVVMLANRDIQGNPMGFVPIGNVPDLKITVSTSVLEHQEAHTGQRGTDLRLTTETKCALSMTLENFIADNLALVSRGQATKVVAGSATGEAITAYLGKVVSLAHIQVSSVVVSDGVTPLVAGTDYFVNDSAGSIKFADTITGVLDGDVLDVDYSFAEQQVVDALTQGTKEMYMRFEGLNTAEGNTPVVIEVFKFSTDPFKELSLIGTTIQSFVLEGSVLADSLHSLGSLYFTVTKLN